jgi:glutaminyl-tRNA synthetase
MPTLSGMRRRGYPPEAIRDFCARLGVAKRNSVVDFAQLEHSVRDDLNRRAERRMGVLRPLRVVLENYPEDRVEMMEAVNNPEDEGAGTRQVPFSRVLTIEREDFMEDPPPKFYRLSPGKEVRLRYAYLVKCTDVVRDPRTGEVTEVRCTYDPESRGGTPADGRRVKATLHWVSAKHAIPGEVRLYEHLFSSPNPDDEAGDITELLNPHSREVLTGAWLEPSLAGAAPGTRIQLERLGYFAVDPDSRPDRVVLNRTVTLRDEWTKLQKTGKTGASLAESA